MTYHTFAQFEPHFSAAQSAAHSFHGTAKSLPNVTASDAWNLYNNTKNATLAMQVFGRHIFDAEGAVRKFMSETPVGTSRQMPDFMQGITNVETANFGKANDTDSGSLLMAGKDKWNFTINDCWLLGGVHGHQEFHPASPINFRNIYHNTFILTITGRELFGLALAGYVEREGHKAMGRLYAPSSKQKADALDLITYQSELAKMKTVEGAKAFFEKAKFEVL